MRTLLGMTAAVALAATAVVTVAAAPAAAIATYTITGHEVERGMSAIDSFSEKTAYAYCEEGKRVTGGGGGLGTSLGHQTSEVLITVMKPVHGTYRDYFMVRGHETDDGEDDTWFVEAIAICVDEIPGMHIESSISDVDSDKVKLETVACDAGEVVLGSGAMISGGYGFVGLQVMRASLDTDFTYAQGHEEFAYSANWYIIAYAVCADPPSGYEIEQWASDEDDSEASKFSYVQCDEGKRIYGVGAGLAFDATSHASLFKLGEPFFDDRQSYASAVENTPTTADWDFIVAQATCAY